MIPDVGAIVRDRNGHMLRVLGIKHMSRLRVKSVATGDVYDGISIYEVDVVKAAPPRKLVVPLPPIKRACDHCGAGVDEPCRTPSGDHIGGGHGYGEHQNFHAVRRGGAR